MKTNPGGYISPSEVVGRDKLIGNLWRILERQSLVLSSERRMGKTSVVKKMVAEAPPGKLPIYHDLEGVRTPLEFVEIVFHDVERYLSGLKRTAERARLFLAQLRGTEVGGIIKFPGVVAPHWKDLLAKTIEDLVEHQDRTVIFFWDEMPLMLYNIKANSGESVAMEILDALRSLRQMHPDLRMVFTGSIGLHNVITSLKRIGYANDPTNDMYPENLPPLSSEAAQELACRLLKGENISTDDIQTTTHAIATAVDCIPYYIHHVVDQLKNCHGTVNTNTVKEIVNTCLTDSYDRWHMHHYVERIDTYYTSEENPFALVLLDILATSRQPIPFDELFNLLKSNMATENSEMVRHILTLLQRDHYIIQQADGKYCFRFPLIQRWWQLHRG